MGALVAGPLAQAHRRPPKGRRIRLPRLPAWLALSWSGTLGAVLFAAAAFTPSLLPRSWGLQALIDGISAGIGYGLGVFAGWLVCALLEWRLRPSWRRWAWRLLAAAAMILLGLAHWWGQRWQRDVRALMGMATPPEYEWLPILLLAVAVFVGIVALARAVRWLTREVTRPLTRVLPAGLAQVVAVVLVAVALVAVNTDVVRPGLIDLASRSFSGLNEVTSPGTVRPGLPERSGSPASLVAWATLGRMGRDFVAGGPTVAQLTAFSGRPAVQPVRAYAGLTSAPTLQARADLAVRELQRTGGLDRQVLVVATSTGTGWIDEAAASAVEYLFNGDTAIVSMQYSYLPSWISFLADRDKAREAGRVLFDTVYAAWAARPAGERPALYLLGESLGVFSGEAAFTGLADLLGKVHGVVWTGPPEASVLHTAFVTGRDAGSSPWLPVFGQGRHVRFAAHAEDLARPPGPWLTPRVVYLEHASDPIVRWTPALALKRPAWLATGPDESAGDVSRDMRWIPFVTFWQVSADLPFSREVPDGHGHRYGRLYADAWAAVAQPAGWSASDTARLRAVLAVIDAAN